MKKIRKLFLYFFALNHDEPHTLGIVLFGIAGAIGLPGLFGASILGGFVLGIVGFIAGAFDYLGSGFSLLYSFTIKPVFWLLPRFDGEFNPTRFMISAKLLTWPWLIRVYSITVFAKGVLLLLFGMLVFSNREIAKTFV